MDVLSAAHALSTSPVFARTSIRHLVDLVELAASDGVVIPFDGRPRKIEAPFVLVTSGRAHARALGGHQLPLGSGDLLWTNQPVFTEMMARRAESGLINVGVHITSTAREGTEVLPLRAEILRDAANASSSFGRSVDLRPVSPEKTTLHDLLRAEAELFAGPGAAGATQPTAWEFIWMCQDPATIAPMEALTRILAAATATEFKGAPAIVIAEDTTLDVVMWNSSGDFEDRAPIPNLGAINYPSNEFHRIFVLRPSAPNQLPATVPDVQFDRIVWVTDRPIARAPTTLTDHLKQPPASAGAEPYFSSFVPSIFKGGPALRGPRFGSFPPLGPLLRAVTCDAFSFVRSTISEMLGIPTGSDGFRSEPLEEKIQMTAGGITSAPRSRTDRDSCRLRLDLAEITRRWQAGDPRTFHRTVFPEAAKQESVKRWARAVTNRRIGLAASGGGATSYRIVAFVEKLQDQHDVPIDVVAGLSAGVALAVYYCRDGRNGLDEYRSLSGNLVAAIGALLAPLTSQAIESGTDWVFGNTTLDDLEIRLVAVTGALPEHGPPEPSAVAEGTLGQALRVASSLPLFYGRTVKNGTVYADGVCSAVVPARPLANYGADYIFACNSIPGPDRRNPLSNSLWGEFAYRFTPIGPVLDSSTSMALMAQQTGRDAGLWAHEFVEVSPKSNGASEIFRWDRVGAILKEARNDSRLSKGAARCGKFWKDVKPDPP